MQFKQAYRKAGVEFDAAELPDHLSVVLEFGALYDAETAWRLLNDHRAGIEMLRIALAEKGSAWHDLMLALGATLPELKGEDEDKMLALIAQGPPCRRGRAGPAALCHGPPAQPPRRRQRLRVSDGRPRQDHPGRSALMDTFLFLIFPYLCLAVFVVGHYWRYKYDKFGWTTRSSQLYENRLLRWGSPLFHFGLLGVIGGHVIGLVVPKNWTEAMGISEDAYHFVAVAGRPIAGAATLLGLVILIYRRRTVGPVFSATTRMDKLMYVFLAAVIVLGIWNTLAASIFGHYDYREGVSPWFRSIFLPAEARADGRRRPRLPAPRADRVRALRAVALHPAGARVQRARRLHHPALHRLPQPGRGTRGHPCPQAGLGEGRPLTPR